MQWTRVLITIAGLLAPGYLPLSLCAEGRILVGTPRTISAPGSYVVTRNLYDPGTVITISSQDVSLNLNGFLLESTNDTSPVIEITADNVTVRNGRLLGGSNSILVTSSANFVLEDVTTTNAANEGVRLFEIEGFSVRRAVFQNHGTHGIWIDASGTPTHAGGSIVDSAFITSGTAIRVHDITGVTIVRNEISFMPGTGIDLSDVASGLVRHNTFDGNVGTGIILQGATRGALVTDNAISGASMAGISVAADDNLLWGNTITNCQGDGMTIDGSENRVEGNLLAGNMGVGLHLGASSSGNVYGSNTARNNNAVDFLNEGAGNTSAGDNFLPNLQ